jgi:hypothetical protein
MHPTILSRMLFMLLLASTPVSVLSQTSLVSESIENGHVATQQDSDARRIAPPSAPVVNLTPTSLSFGTQTDGTTSAGQTITLKNTGNAQLSITSIALNGTYMGQFSETSTCGTTLT